MKRPAFLLGLLTFFSVFPQLSYAGMCAMCRRTLEMTGNQGLVKGFLLSILLIGGMPLLIGGFVFFFFSRQERKAREKIKENTYVQS